MPINFTTLTGTRATDGSIRNWLNNDSIDTALILTEAQAWIYQRLRVRDNRTSTSGTMTTSQSSIAHPTGYRSTYRLGYEGTITGRLRKQLPETILDHRVYDVNAALTTGVPSEYADDGSTIILDKAAHKALTYRLDYFYALPALSTDTETNFLTDKYPSLLKSACLFKGYEWLKNRADREYWMKQALGEITALDIDKDRELENAEIDVVITDGY